MTAKWTRGFRWLLCEIFGYAGDHGWQSVYEERPVTLITGEVAKGKLMMRTRRAKREYRHEQPWDRAGAHLQDMTDV